MVPPRAPHMGSFQAKLNMIMTENIRAYSWGSNGMSFIIEKVLVWKFSCDKIVTDSKRYQLQGRARRCFFVKSLPMFSSTQMGETTSDLLHVVSRKPAVVSFRALCCDLLSATRGWRQKGKNTARATTKTASSNSRLPRLEGRLTSAPIRCALF